VRKNVEAGKVIRRARIVSEPMSVYMRWIWETAYQNVVAGEELRWLPRKRASVMALPGNDFWIFDDRTVLFNYFTGDGDWVGQELVTDGGAARLCGAAFDTVWNAAIPHGEYKPD
jgi:hypothetical protein